ncbi:MAG: anion permease [Candidatus Alcyoniella australis]|nr:anion permease [Candidatus Alcyoniella australis]
MISDPQLLKAISLTIFLAAYAAFVIWPTRRAQVSAAAAGLAIITGVVSLSNAFWSSPEGYGGSYVNWNVMGVFFGTLVIAEFFMFSRMPEVLAEKLLSRMSSARGALVVLCLFGGVLSMFLENVAAFLILAPIGLTVARRMGKALTPVMVGLVLQSNLHGAGTMIGDPPDMLLAGYTRMGFPDFFWFFGRPSLFFAVMVGSLTGSLVLWLSYRSYKGKIEIKSRTKPTSWFPLIMIGMLIVGLGLSKLIDPGFVWAAGTITMCLALIGTVWYMALTKGRILNTEEHEALIEAEYEGRTPPRQPLLNGTAKLWQLVRHLDWDTTVFLMGIFIVVGGFTHYWVDDIAGVMAGISSGSVLVAFVLIVLSSVTCSAFIDNVPFLLTMLPVTDALGVSLGLDPWSVQMFFLYFGLLIGVSVGGNITPIGATANVVAIGYLRRRGEPVRFLDYMKRGLPFTLAATFVASIFLVVFWYLLV